MTDLQLYCRRYAADVRALLGNSSGAAEVPLNITLHPAIPYTQEQHSSYPYEVPSNTFMLGVFEHFNFLRKPASDWGWDWGPAFAPSGIQGEVQLLALSTAYLAGG